MSTDMINSCNKVKRSCKPALFLIVNTNIYPKRIKSLLSYLTVSTKMCTYSWPCAHPMLPNPSIHVLPGTIFPYNELVAALQ